MARQARRAEAASSPGVSEVLSQERQPHFCRVGVNEKHCVGDWGRSSEKLKSARRHVSCLRRVSIAQNSGCGEREVARGRQMICSDGGIPAQRPDRCTTACRWQLQLCFNQPGPAQALSIFAASGGTSHGVDDRIAFRKAALEQAQIMSDQ